MYGYSTKGCLNNDNNRKSIDVSSVVPMCVKV